jgi:hypothetical protein
MSELDSNGAVITADNLLAPHEHEALWQFFLSQDFKRVHDSKLTRVYRLADGESWVSGSHLLRIHEQPSTKLPPAANTSSNPLMRLFQAMFALDGFDRFTAGFAPWSHIGFSCSLYPPGCGLGWHADQGHSAAFIYYVHPEWRDGWGGELLLEDASVGRSENKPVPGSRHREFYGSVSQALQPGTGAGRYLAPLPNRLVVFRSGVRHTVKKVDPAAGDAFRAAISGFFTIQSSD